jgi:hypothetical protein
MKRSTCVLAVVIGVFQGAAASSARAECDCIAIAAEVEPAAQAIAMQADNLYARGEVRAALEAYVRGYEASKDASFLYAQARCHARLGDPTRARALLKQYLAASGQLRYKADAEAVLTGATAIGGAVGVTAAGAAAGGVGAAAGGVGAAASVGGDVAGSLTARAEPPRVAKGAAMLLGVVAVAAVGAVAVQSISAGVSEDVEFDTKFNLSLGLTGAVVGGTAFYLYGLRAASSVTCAADLPRREPTRIVAPMALPGGAGVTALARF